MTLDERIDAAVAAAPPLSEAQIVALAAIFAPVADEPVAGPAPAST